MMTALSRQAVPPPRCGLLIRRTPCWLLCDKYQTRLNCLCLRAVSPHSPPLCQCGIPRRDIKMPSFVTDVAMLLLARSINAGHA
eukprot:836773-Amphidinium_carterae.1